MSGMLSVKTKEGGLIGEIGASDFLGYQRAARLNLLVYVRQALNVFRVGYSIAIQSVWTALVCLLVIFVAEVYSAGELSVSAISGYEIGADQVTQCYLVMVGLVCIVNMVLASFGVMPAGFKNFFRREVFRKMENRFPGVSQLNVVVSNS